MTTPSARMLVWVDADTACVKIVGRANCNSVPDFKTLLSELCLKGYSRFVIDLSECALMDSSFLGALAGAGLELNGANQPAGNHAVRLYNPNARIAELLENVGIAELFQITRGHPPAEDAAPLCERETTAHSREELTRACLEAHTTLITLNPANAAKFKDVTQFLAEDLKKLEKR